MKTIAVVNQKGGVGKSTTCMNLAGGLVRLGAKVLLIDLDPQAHLTYGLAIQAHELDYTISDVLMGKTTIQDAMLLRGSINIIPASFKLEETAMRLLAFEDRNLILKNAFKEAEKELKKKREIHYVILDTPPSLGLLTQNALAFATEVFIPVQTEFLPLHGLGRLIETIEIAKERLNPNLKLSGLIATLYDDQRKLNREIKSQLKKRFGDLLFNTVIREDTALAQAPGSGQNVFEFAPKSHGAEDYMNLCQEIIER